MSSSFTACWRSGVLGWPLAVSSLFIMSMRDCGIVTPFTTILPAAAFFGGLVLGDGADGERARDERDGEGLQGGVHGCSSWWGQNCSGANASILRAWMSRFMRSPKAS